MKPAKKQWFQPPLALPLWRKSGKTLTGHWCATCKVGMGQLETTKTLAHVGPAVNSASVWFKVANIQ